MSGDFSTLSEPVICDHCPQENCPYQEAIIAQKKVILVPLGTLGPEDSLAQYTVILRGLLIQRCSHFAEIGYYVKQAETTATDHYVHLLYAIVPLFFTAKIKGIHYIATAPLDDLNKIKDALDGFGLDDINAIQAMCYKTSHSEVYTFTLPLLPSDIAPNLHTTDQDQMSDGGYNPADAFSSRDSTVTSTSYFRSSTTSSNIFASKMQENVALEEENISLPVITTDGNVLICRIITYESEVGVDNIAENQGLLFLIGVVDGGCLLVLQHGTARRILGYAPKLPQIGCTSCHHQTAGQPISIGASVLSTVLYLYKERPISRAVRTYFRSLVRSVFAK